MREIDMRFGDELKEYKKDLVEIDDPDKMHRALLGIIRMFENRGARSAFWWAAIEPYIDAWKAKFGQYSLPNLNGTCIPYAITWKLNLANKPLSERDKVHLGALCAFAQHIDLPSLELSLTKERIIAISGLLGWKSLRTLRLSGINNVEIATLLANVLKKNALVYLKFQGGFNDVGIISALAPIFRRGTITHLDLSSNDISSTGAIIALGTVLKNTTVTHLDLSWTQLNKKTLTALSALRGTNVTHLILSSMFKFDKNTVAVLSALRGTLVTHLDLSWCWDLDEKIDTTALAAALVDTEVTSLILGSRGERLDKDAVVGLAALRHTLVTSLELTFCASLDKDAIEAFKVLRGTAVTNLKLHEVEKTLDRTAVKALALALQDTAIAHLDLYWREMEKGVEALSALADLPASITSLSLNSIESEEAVAALANLPASITSLALALDGYKEMEMLISLGEVLQNSSITCLILSNRRFGRDDLSQLHLQNTAVTKLDLRHNKFKTEEEQLELVDVLRNTNVIELVLFDNGNENRIIPELRKVLTDNAKRPERPAVVVPNHNGVPSAVAVANPAVPQMSQQISSLEQKLLKWMQDTNDKQALTTTQITSLRQDLINLISNGHSVTLSKLQNLLTATEQVETVVSSTREDVEILKEGIKTLRTERQLLIDGIEKNIHQKMQDFDQQIGRNMAQVVENAQSIEVIEQRLTQVDEGVKGEAAQKIKELEADIAELRNALDSDVEGMRGSLDEIAQEVRTNKDNAARNAQAIDRTNRAIGPQFWVYKDVEDLLRKATNNNAKVCLDTFVRHFYQKLYILHLVMANVIESKSLFWDLEEPTPAFDMAGGISEAVKGGVSLGQALAEGIPFVAAGSKLLVGGINKVKLHRAQNKAGKVLKGLDLGNIAEVATRLAVTAVDANLAFLNQLPEFENAKKEQEKDKKKKDKYQYEPAERFARLLVKKMMQTVINSEYKITPDNVESTLLSGLNRFGGEEKGLFKGGNNLRGLHRDKIMAHMTAVSEIENARKDLAQLTPSPNAALLAGAAAGPFAAFAGHKGQGARLAAAAAAPAAVQQPQIGNP
jgi:hypothetical protein